MPWPETLILVVLDLGWPIAFLFLFQFQIFSIVILFTFHFALIIPKVSSSFN